MRHLWRRRRLRQLRRLRRHYARPASHALATRDAGRRGRAWAAVAAAALCLTTVSAARGPAEGDDVAPARSVARPVTPLLARPATTQAQVSRDVPAPRFARSRAGEPRAQRRLARAHRVYRFATRYGVSTELAGAIHDAAVAEGIEPELAFRLVRTESEFNERATSPVGAVGLTQLMPSTARYFTGAIARERLYDRQLNLRVGFRYLRGLIREYDSLRLALLVYNRGPRAVEASLSAGLDPANGYEVLVAKGYRGRGTID